MARPALAALQEQQQVLQGIQTTAQRREAMHREAFSTLRTLAQRQGQELHQLREQNRQLAIGLRAIARAAGIEQHVAAAMFRTADVQNPAQPVPEPAPSPPSQTTVDAETPEAMGDVQTPGMVGGSTQDVAADATSTVYTPGDDIAASPFKNLVDVTSPIEGTQGPQPLSNVRTETDVRVGDPMNPEVAFPLRGPFQNGQSLRGQSSRQEQQDGASNRTMASLRLARLRIATHTAESEDDIAVATGIERDASLSTDAIEKEIVTLEGVSKAASRQQRPQGGRGLVPRTASAAPGVQRTVPSMQRMASGGGGSLQPTTTDREVEDADLFD